MNGLEILVEGGALRRTEQAISYLLMAIPIQMLFVQQFLAQTGNDPPHQLESGCAGQDREEMQKPCKFFGLRLISRQVQEVQIMLDDLCDLINSPFVHRLPGVTEKTLKFLFIES